MAKLNTGLNKTIGVTYGFESPEFTEELEAGVRDFLSERGIDESSRRKGIVYKFIEYNAQDMTVSWKRLLADLEDAYPSLKTEYSEGTEDEPEDSYMSDYEHLEIFM